MVINAACLRTLSPLSVLKHALGRKCSLMATPSKRGNEYERPYNGEDYFDYGTNGKKHDMQVFNCGAWQLAAPLVGIRTKHGE